MRDALPEVVPSACFTPHSAASSCSKVWTFRLKAGSSGRPYRNR